SAGGKVVLGNAGGSTMRASTATGPLARLLAHTDTGRRATWPLAHTPTGRVPHTAMSRLAYSMLPIPSSATVLPAPSLTQASAQRSGPIDPRWTTPSPTSTPLARLRGGPS